MPEVSEVQQYVADLIEHPGWTEVCQFAANMAIGARGRGQSLLHSVSVDEVALLAVNVEATKDTLRAFIFGVYAKAGVAVPKPLREALS